MADKQRTSVAKQSEQTKSLTSYEALELLERINELVQTDFAFDMDCHALPNSKPFTQAEAKEMARIIGRVYSLAHRTTCEACRRTIWDRYTSVNDLASNNSKPTRTHTKSAQFPKEPKDNKEDINE
jgi:hypothetical protein